MTSGGDEDDRVKNDIYQFLKDHYQLSDQKETVAQLDNFIFPLESYFNIEDAVRESVQNEMEDYYKRVIEDHRHDFSRSGLAYKINSDLGEKDTSYTVFLEMDYTFNLQERPALKLTKRLESEIKLIFNDSDIKIYSIRTPTSRCKSSGKGCEFAPGIKGKVDKECNCTPLQDADNDGDGIPLSEDCNDNDSNIGRKGDICDDGNDETSNDRIQADCTCRGSKFSSAQDEDGDGIIASADCDDNNPDIGRRGDPCDDGDPTTTDERLDDNCECVASTEITTYYYDEDDDGLGDENIYKEFPQGNNPAKWVLKTGDQCPGRKGDVDGCPQLMIAPPSNTILVGQEVELKADPQGLLPKDRLKWSGHSSLELFNPTNRTIRMTGNTVGKYDVSYGVENLADPVSNRASMEIEIKISTDQVRKILQPLVVQGSSRGGGKFEQQSKAAMDELFRHTVSENITVYDESGIDRGPLKTFLTTDVKLGLPTNKHDLKIVDVSYDSVSGKISELYIEFR
ncbi:MAG: hypothetical protein AAGA77_20275 [Bacteroidota bacterium]